MDGVMARAAEWGGRLWTDITGPQLGLGWKRSSMSLLWPFSDRKWEPTWVLEPGLLDHGLTHPSMAGVSPTR